MKNYFAMARRVSPPATLTVAQIVSFVYPSVSRGGKPTWPPDAFAVAASVLRHSGAYTEIVNSWPPRRYKDTDAWQEFIENISASWRRRYIKAKQWPIELERWWNTVQRAGSLAVADVRTNRRLVEALAGIVAAADQTSFGFGIVPVKPTFDAMANIALASLIRRDSLCLDVDPSRATVLPKLHNPLNGMTLRSLTHNLAFWDTREVSPRWEQVPSLPSGAGLNLLVLPWPLRINPRAFRIADGCGEKMPDGFGFFAYDIQSRSFSVPAVKKLLKQAEKLVGTIHAVAFPELSLLPQDFVRLRKAMGNRLVIGGTGTPATRTTFGSNRVAVGLGPTSRIREQSKHHRWRLDASQIEQYGLGACLTEQKWWWEAIHISDRSCTFFSANEWLTFCVLICEDLARQDPVAELVRSVGPNLVVALLLDGPQIAERWSARYATVLAEDPRSSVLTLTSAGLVDLARSQRHGGPRSVGLWKDPSPAQRAKSSLRTAPRALSCALRGRCIKNGLQMVATMTRVPATSALAASIKFIRRGNSGTLFATVVLLRGK